MKKSYVLLLLIFLFICFTGTALASYGTDHIKKGKNTNAPYFYVWKDWSVESYGWNDSYYNAIIKWLDAGSKALLLVETIENNAGIKVYVCYDCLPYGVYGESTYWKSNGTQITATQTTNGTNWDISRAVVDHKRAVEEQDFTTSQRHKLVGHEIGHGLSLNELNSHSGDHWMKQNNRAMDSPSSVDIDHLKKKFGEN